MSRRRVLPSLAALARRGRAAAARQATTATTRLPPVTPCRRSPGSARYRSHRRRCASRSWSSVRRSTPTAPRRELIGEVAEGNRVLMIGDSILASTSSRYGGQMCEESCRSAGRSPSRPSRAASSTSATGCSTCVLDDATPEEDWNAAVVFLGQQLRRRPRCGTRPNWSAILDRLAPRPTLLLTVTEYRPDYVEVNEVVSRQGAERDNVTVLDWKTISETPGVLSSDRLHPTDAGRRGARRVGRRRTRPVRRRR